MLELTVFNWGIICGVDSIVVVKCTDFAFEVLGCGRFVDSFNIPARRFVF